MKVLNPAIAGTLESSDAQVSIEPGNGSVEVSIASTVMAQYGRQIRETVLDTLKNLEVDDAVVTVNDHGALDCTLRARTECAVFRSCGKSAAGVPWGGVIK